MISVPLFMALLILTEPSNRTLLAQVPTQPLSSTAVMVVEWEDTRKPTERFNFYRRGHGPDRESEGSTWSVTRDGPRPRDVIVSSATCPPLSPQMDKLETMQIGPALSPPSVVPPRIRLGPALYTIQGRNQSLEGWSQNTQVSAQAGPFADWGRDTYAILETCSTGHSSDGAH